MILDKEQFLNPSVSFAGNIIFFIFSYKPWKQTSACLFLTTDEFLTKSSFYKRSLHELIALVAH